MNSNEETRNQRIWKVAERIIAIQKKTYEMPEAEKLNNVDWEMLEGEWFDFIQDELFPEPGNPKQIVDFEE